MFLLQLCLIVGQMVYPEMKLSMPNCPVAGDNVCESPKREFDGYPWSRTGV